MLNPQSLRALHDLELNSNTGLFKWSTIFLYICFFYCDFFLSSRSLCYWERMFALTSAVCSLGKTLLAFALLHFVLQGQTCLLLQVSLAFLLLYSSPLWLKKKKDIFFFFFWWRGTKEPLDKGERGEKKKKKKTGLKLNIQKTKIEVSNPITWWQIDGGKNGNGDRLNFLGLQNHCGLWLQSWN